MGARSDLLSAAADAAHAAAHASEHSERIAHLGAAKTALEAAALASDTPASEIDAALEELRAILGVGEDASPREVLLGFASEAQSFAESRAQHHAYAVVTGRLMAMLTRLERDFTAGGTATSLRLASRIRTALDETGQIIKDASP